MSSIEQQLSQYLLEDHEAQQIANNQASINQINLGSSLTTMQGSACMFYQLGLTYVTIMIIVIIALSYAGPTYEQGGEKYIIWVLMAISGVIGLYWAITAYRKQYLTPYWSVFWGHYAVGLIFGVYVLISKSVMALLWSLLVSVIIFLAAELWFLRSVWILFITISINGSCLLLLADTISRKEDSAQIRLSLDMCISMIIFTVIGTWILAKHLKDKWRYMELIEKYFSLCLIYLCVMAYCVCMMGFFSFSALPWPVLTIPNFVIFLLICRYFHKILPRAHEKYHPKKILIFFRDVVSEMRSTSTSNSSNNKQQKLFQVSLCLLCSQQDYVECTRDSVLGRPLSQCVCCLSQESTFCYYACKHACIGTECAANWLMKNVRKCPICRMESSFIVRVQRIDHIEFAVIGKYKFKDESV